VTSYTPSQKLSPFHHFVCLITATRKKIFCWVVSGSVTFITDFMIASPVIRNLWKYVRFVVQNTGKQNFLRCSASILLFYLYFEVSVLRIYAAVFSSRITDRACMKQLLVCFTFWPSWLVVKLKLMDRILEWRRWKLAYKDFPSLLREVLPFISFYMWLCFCFIYSPSSWNFGCK
jgi:hypothetical protein